MNTILERSRTCDRSEALSHCLLGALRTALCFFPHTVPLSRPPDAGNSEPDNSRIRAVHARCHTVRVLWEMPRKKNKGYSKEYPLFLSLPDGMTPLYFFKYYLDKLEFVYLLHGQFTSSNFSINSHKIAKYSNGN